MQGNSNSRSCSIHRRAMMPTIKHPHHDSEGERLRKRAHDEGLGGGGGGQRGNADCRQLVAVHVNLG